MKAVPLSAFSRVLGFLPKGTNSFLLVESRVSTLSADVPGLFQADGVQIDFEAGHVTDGTVSLWLTMEDAHALAASLGHVLDEVGSGREART